MNSRVFYTLIRLAVVCAALGLAAGCDDVSTAELKTPVYKTGLKDSDDNKTSAFRKDFPLQAASYDRNNESTFMSKYKGSVNFMKNDDVDPLPEGYKQAAQPYLKNLWLGYPFMYEYREARGHTYAIHDILEIDRINRYGEKGGMPATCWNCKTPKMVQWIKQYGDDFWAKDFNQFRTEVTDDDSIGCATCHNAETMQLQLYSEPLKDYLKSVGKDPAKLPRGEMRSLVCAQCHVEYYFNDPGHGPTKRPVFPWKNGFTPEAIYSVYEDNGNVDMPGFKGKFADWVHPVSQTPMLKMQHPDYETWIDGPHGAAGVACADCHMPYQREEGKKMSSHWWTSPLRDPELRACRQCMPTRPRPTCADASNTRRTRPISSFSWRRNTPCAPTKPCALLSSTPAKSPPIMISCSSGPRKPSARARCSGISCPPKTASGSITPPRPSTP